MANDAGERLGDDDDDGMSGNDDEDSESGRSSSSSSSSSGPNTDKLKVGCGSYHHALTNSAVSLFCHRCHRIQEQINCIEDSRNRRDRLVL
jgi:hypothetical protein